MISGSIKKFETSCFTCNEDPIPIMRFIDRTSKNERTYNVLLGCSNGHITPFVIKPDNEHKIQIKKNDSILNQIKRFEVQYSDIISYFKSQEEFKGTYASIIKSIISDDQKGAIIHMRYLLEIHQKTTFFRLVSQSVEDQEMEWSDLKGSRLYTCLINDKRTNEKWYCSLSDTDKSFLESNQDNIKYLKRIYIELSEQLHYFNRDRTKYKYNFKKELGIQGIRDKFKELLNISTNIRLIFKSKKIQEGYKEEGSEEL